MIDFVGGVGCLLREEKLFDDERGFFTEIWKKSTSRIDRPFDIKQWNLSTSKQNTIRGLHYNIRSPQAKMIRVLNGSIIDVVIDLRNGSPYYGIVKEYTMSKPSQVLYVPEGFAHGFWALEDNTILLYGCSNEYDPKADRGISPLDDQFDFPWKNTKEELFITDKDRNWSKHDIEWEHFRYDSDDRFSCTRLLHIGRGS